MAAASLFFACALLALLAVAAIPFARARLRPDRHAAAWFAAPGVPAALGALALALAGAPSAAVPAATMAILFAAAGACLLPGRRAHFAAFERDFWAYVERRSPARD